MKKVILFNNSSLSFRVHRKVIFDKLIELGYNVSIILPEVIDLDPDFLESYKECIHILPFDRKGVNAFNEFRTLWQLRQLLKKEKPDIIHNFTIKCVIYGSIAAGLSGVKKIVNTITGLGYAFTNFNAKTALLRSIILPFYSLVFLMRNVVVIFQNADDQKLLTGLVPFNVKTELVYGSGVDVHFFKPETKTQGRPVTITCVSRLLTEKGIETLVKAIEILNKETTLPPYQGWIIGNTDKGNPGSYSDATVASWEKVPNLKLWGFQRDIKSFLQKSDIFCLPSQREGLPMAILEGEAMALPIVTTNAPGCKDTVTSENGFLFEVGNAHQLAEKLKALILNANLRESMGAKSRTLAESRFSKEIVTDKIIKIYNT